jgi:DNA-binding protein YbaB
MMQSAMNEVSVTSERDGIKVTANGNMEVTELIIPNNISAEQTESLKSIINDTLKQAQRKAAQKMQEMGGLSNLGL